MEVKKNRAVTDRIAALCRKAAAQGAVLLKMKMLFFRLL